MISRIQYGQNLNFRGSEATAPATKPQELKQEAPTTPQPVEKEKFSITKTYDNAKKSVVNFFKGINNITGVTGGAAQGVAKGAATAVAIGVIGKSWKDGNGEIIKTAGNILTNVWKGVKIVPNAIKNIWIQSPKDNIVKAFKSLGEAAKSLPQAMKKYKLTTVVALLAGFGVAAYNTIKGKINANDKNADLDHKTNMGHIK